MRYDLRDLRDLEQLQIDSLTHRFVASIAWVQVIAGIVCRQEFGRRRRVARHLIEIDHGVVGAARADPSIQRLALGFALGRPVGSPLERRQRRAVDFETPRTCSRDELLVPGDQVLCVGVGFARAMPMSLMPSMTMTCVTPVCIRTSRSNRASALTPAPSPRT